MLRSSLKKNFGWNDFSLLLIKIDKDVVDPEDVEMLEDLVMAAVNEALRNAEAMMEKEMKKLTGGMNIPGLF